MGQLRVADAFNCCNCKSYCTSGNVLLEFGLLVYTLHNGCIVTASDADVPSITPASCCAANSCGSRPDSSTLFPCTRTRNCNGELVSSCSHHPHCFAPARAAAASSSCCLEGPRTTACRQWCTEHAACCCCLRRCTTCNVFWTVKWCKRTSLARMAQLRALAETLHCSYPHLLDWRRISQRQSQDK